MISYEALQAAREHAMAEYPKESVGIVSLGVYHPVENTAEDPTTNFRIDGDTYFDFLNSTGVEAIIHSHPDGPDFPSQEDMQQQQATAVPWCILVTASASDCTNGFWFGDGSPAVPLIGRGFRHGVTDCYSLIRDWYKQEKNIELPDFARNDEWWNKGDNLYLDNFKKAGFYVVSADEVQEGDVFLATIRSKVPNHAGVYLGNGLVMHHLMNKLSRREPVTPWQKFITAWIRHSE